MFVAVSIPT